MGYPSSYKEIPFLRLLVPLVAGISLGIISRPLFDAAMVLSVVLVSFCVVLIALFLSRRWPLRHIYGVTLNLFLFIVGYSVVTLKPTASVLTEGKSLYVVAQLVEPPVVRERSVRMQVKLEGEWRNGLFYSIDERMLLYFSQTDTNAFDLQYGDIIGLRLKPKFPAPPQNPEEFSYKRYLARRGVFATAFVRNNEWLLVDHGGNPLFAFAYRLQENMIALLIRSGLKDQELAVASALSMGYKTLLDDETRRVYSGSGAMHLLAVSGLHVGLLFVLLSWLLASLKGTRSGRLIRFVALVAFLWFFAVLTGLSASVQRSAFMFSMVALAEVTTKRSSIFNTLTASAFVLLLINPFNLVEIGFQLSYLAVFSILVFSPILTGMASPNYRITKRLWELLMVSVAAQIGTTAISVFYFNQFPSYFWVTNLFAVPLATWSLYLLIALYAFAPVPLVSEWIGWLSNIAIGLLNKGLATIEAAPGATLQGLHLSGTQFMLLMLLLVFAIWWIFKGRVQRILVFLLVVAALAGETALKKIGQSKASEALVLSSYGKSAIVFVDGNSALALLDSSLYSNIQQRKFLLGKLMASRGCFSSAQYLSISDSTSCQKSLRTTTFAKGDGLIFADYKGQRIAIPIGDALARKRTKNPLVTDYLIVTKDCKLRPRALPKLFNPRVVIVDSSVPEWNATLIFASFNPSQTEYWHTLSNGYYRIEDK